MTEDVDRTLAAIDDAIGGYVDTDYSVGPDAMRWAPQPPEALEPTLAAVGRGFWAPVGTTPLSPDWRSFGTVHHPAATPRRTSCSRAEAEAWFDEAGRLETPDEIPIIGHYLQVIPTRRFPPCLSCQQLVDTVTLHDENRLTFSPCGCDLRMIDTMQADSREILVSLTQLPTGTRPARYVMQEIDPRYLTERNTALDFLARKMAHSLGDDQHVVVRLDPDNQVEPFKARRPDAVVVMACTLQAIPGATPFIVFRPSTDLPEGTMPPHWDGVWYERDGMISRYPIRFMSEPAGTLTANPSGRVEINAGGDVAEVYEVTRD